MRRPHGLVLRGSSTTGILYVADYDGHAIRALRLGACPAAGVGDHARVLVSALGADAQGHKIRPRGLSYPRGLALDPAGLALWVTDMGHRVQRLDFQGVRQVAIGRCGFADGGHESEDGGARFRLARAPCKEEEVRQRRVVGASDHGRREAPPAGLHGDAAASGAESAMTIFYLHAYPRSGTNWLLDELQSTGRIFVPPKREMLLKEWSTRRR